MKNLNLTHKLVLIIAVLGLISLLVSVNSARQAKALSGDYVALLEGSSAAAQHIAQSGAELQGMRGAIGSLMMSRTAENNAAAEADLNRFMAAFKRSIDLAAASVPENEEIRWATSADMIVQEACKESVALAAKATDLQAIADSQSLYLRDCGPAFAEILPRFDELATTIRDEARERSIALQAAAKRTSSQAVLFAVLAAAASLTAGVIGVRVWVIRPLSKLVVLMGQLSAGRLDVEIDGQERKDELGQMVRAVAVFRDNAVKVAEVEASKAAVAEAEAERARRMAEATDGLAGGLRRMADGDLSVELSEPYAAEFEPLRTDFNSVARSLRESMSKVAMSAVRIEEGARAMRDSAEDLSRRTEGQAASIEEQSAALTQITQNVRDTSSRTSEAKREAELASDVAETSRTVVAEACNAMRRIERSSSDIGTISDLIDEISFQTNLLSLNASVEAARAGEAGRGFVVVAQEVRQLAQRSAKAAQEIKELIEKSEGEVRAGVSLVLQAGDSMQRIGEQVGTVNSKLDMIEQAARDQAMALAEITAAVAESDLATQQNAAMSEEGLASASTLSSEADALRQMLTGFKLSVASEWEQAVPGKGVRRVTGPLLAAE